MTAGAHEEDARHGAMLDEWLHDPGRGREASRLGESFVTAPGSDPAGGTPVERSAQRRHGDVTHVWRFSR
jgi:hypothetical protein